MVKRRTIKKYRGGCGCNNNSTKQPGFDSLPKLQLGGNGLPIRYYYGAANYESAPTNPDMITSSRNLPNPQFGGKYRRAKGSRKMPKIKGGRSKRNLSKRMVGKRMVGKRMVGKRMVGKRMVGKRMVGGTALLTNSMSTNAVASFGTMDWASAGSNIISGNSNINPASYSQDTVRVYSAHNSPMA